MPAYQRILLKLSGEALMGDDAFGINRATIVRMVDEIAEVTRLGVQVAIVIGGGNIFRGVAGGSVGMDRATADYMGMLATVMNALALADTIIDAKARKNLSWQDLADGTGLSLAFVTAALLGQGAPMLRPLADVVVKGKTAAVRVYTPCDDADLVASSTRQLEAAGQPAMALDKL